MNATRFRLNVAFVLGAYVLAAITGLWLSVADPPKEDGLSAYAVWKDLLPLIVAIPAAWLGYCFQRRQSYLKDVRELWSKMVPAVQTAIQYTHQTKPTAESYSYMMHQLSTVIDEVRGVFSNIKEEEGSTGFFPFDSLKDIHDKAGALGYTDYDANEASATRREILRLWKRNVRKALLYELPRGTPEYPDSSFLEKKSMRSRTQSPAAGSDRLVE